MQDFNSRLADIQRGNRSVLCVGLDPDPARLPRHLLDAHACAEAVSLFNREIIAATFPYACGYKINFAFYEALGPDGYAVLKSTLEAIPEGLVTVADAKRGDIGNSARFYAKAILGELGFDACTVAPYMGSDAAAPFLSYGDRAAFVLTRTSNPSGREFQELVAGGETVAEHVARQVSAWHGRWPGTAGLVAGATNPGSLARLRELCPSQPLLIPGIGAQGGRLEDLQHIEGPLLICSSRQILYASPGRDFAESAADEARSMQTQMEACGMIPDRSPQETC